VSAIARKTLIKRPQPEVTPELGREHGLSADEYQRILGFLGRTPSYTELGIVSVMWSEHCSYKSSRIHLAKLPTKTTARTRVIQGPGENAGVIDIGDGQAAVFKMESHNHPSFVEPFQGAATGVGGILRDVFTMGARPIANLNSLRFGRPDHPRTRHLVDGVVAGIGHYGNCIGVPTVGGEVQFHAAYDGNILVNAFTLGLARTDRIFLGTASGLGNPVLYVGSKTGRDGIHGASLLASSEFEAGKEGHRPRVQVGDPFTEKLLLEACLELMAVPDLLIGIQDMGAAGLTSSSVEMAARAGSGIELDLDQVPLREDGMVPYEVMLSESQERMLMVVARGREAEALAIFEKWDLDCAVVGHVTDTGRIVLRAHDTTYVDLPIEPLSEGVKYDRPRSRPAYLDELQAFDPRTLPAPADLAAALLAVLGSPTVASKEWVYRQYDHMVQDGTVIRPGAADAAVVRVVAPDGRQKGIALAVDCPSRLCYLDPYEGARLTIAECARNLVCVGAQPLAVTDCLNFGNPEKPEIMWQFVECVRGLADMCRELDIPVVSGNVSLYNETDGKAIYPTPTVGIIGLIDDVTARPPLTQGFQRAGDVIVLLGLMTDELGGSEFLEVVHGKVAGAVPRLNEALELTVQRLTLDAARAGLLQSAHDLSEGGLAIGLAECCLTGPTPLGATIKAATPLRADHWLFSEGASRIVVTVRPDDLPRLAELASDLGAPALTLGTVGGASLSVELGPAGGARAVVVDVPVAELGTAFHRGFARIAE